MSTHYLLGLWDYLVVGTTLIVSATVGIYHGLDKKSVVVVQTANKEEKLDGSNGAAGGEEMYDYFLAGRTMSLFPVALSFFATSCSTLIILGPPMEVYAFGLSFCWFAMTCIPTSLIVSEIFIPLFYNMRSISIYKFLETRYNMRMKEIVTLMIGFRNVAVGNAIIYGTALAFKQVTNINLWIIICWIVGVCVIYTTVGGIKGVMWVDVFQAAIMLICLIVLLVMATYKVGGITNVWKRNYDTGRLNIFPLDLNLTTRHTFWGNFIGLSFYMASYTVTSQSNMHRFLTAPSLNIAKRGSYLGFTLLFMLGIIGMLNGLIMYAEFYRCDPLTSKAVQSMNQIVPIFAASVLGPFPILLGLFFAGFLSACLSTLSSIFNSVSAIVMEALIQPRFPKLSAKSTLFVCQLLAICIGLLSTAGIVVSQRFPNVIQAAISISSSLEGPLLGVIVIGIFAPQANFKVVLTSFIGAILTTFWIVIGGLIINQPLKMKPMFTDGCLTNNETFGLNNRLFYANVSKQIHYSTGAVENSTDAIMDTDSPWVKYFPLHDITFQWVSMIGFLAFTMFCLILSRVFGQDDNCQIKFNPIDIIPKKVQSFQRRLPKIIRRFLLCDVYDENIRELQLEPHCTSQSC